MGVKKLKNAIRQARANNSYLKYYDAPIEENIVLLEAGQGKHTDGNIFAFLRCIETEAEWDNLTPYVVVTKDSKAEAEEKFGRYGFRRVRLVVRNSLEYRRVLATAKYLITDNSFPTYFIKKEGQVVLNTWHGAPLKQLGRADIVNSTSIGNVQKNFLASDWLMQPNSYTRRVMMKDYMVERVFGGKVVTIDYPRNDVLFNAPLAGEIKEKYNLSGKRVIAYMPTWRGTGRNADITGQIKEAEDIIRQIESNLTEDEVLYVNFHFLIGNKMDFSQFSKAKPFPAEYETYDFLAVCDTLISDYSSVMIDFAQTGRQVIMYMYDYEEYLAQKGFYFDIRTLPFGQTYNMEELKEALHAPFGGYDLDDEYLGNHYGKAAETLLRLMCGKCSDEDQLEISDYSSGRETEFSYMGDIGEEGSCVLTEEYLSNLTPEQLERTVLGFEGDMKDKNVIGFLQKLDSRVDFVMMTKGGAITFREYVYLNLNKNHGLFKRKEEDYCRREYERQFSNINCSRFNMFSTNIFELFRAASMHRCETIIHRIPLHFYIRPADVFYRNPGARDEVFSCFDAVEKYDAGYGLDYWNEKECLGAYARATGIKCVTSGGRTTFSGKLIVKTEDPDAELADTVQIGSRLFEDTFEYAADFSPAGRSTKDGLTTIRCGFRFTVPEKDFSRWYTNNLLRVKIHTCGSTICARVLVSGRFGLLKKRVYDLPGTEYVCEIKEDYKHYRLVIRDRNVTDSKAQQIKLAAAFACHVLTPWNKTVLLYEKNSSRYEESASILYEKLMDEGYKKVRYILDNSYPYIDRIPTRYRKNIVPRFSFRHYYSMFAAKSVISTETLGHALEKGATSGLFKTFVIDGSKNYIFLQHGVMYMVSLGSEQREFFKKSKGKGKQRVVVSSQLEATHFTDNTGHSPEDMYVCGLLKFDRSTLNEDADRIVVMLTWRPWEYVSGISDIKDTGYYRLLREIVETTPDELKSKLIVLPHPLIEDQVREDKDDCVWKYYVPDKKYDDILKTAKVLITDYSSISYDAFYRGTNVLFYWKEKDECTREYGDNARLMLTEDLAFGYISWDKEKLREDLVKAYHEEQTKAHLDNYRRIVEHHDGKNTERFIAMAKKDGIL